MPKLRLVVALVLVCACVVGFSVFRTTANTAANEIKKADDISQESPAAISLQQVLATDNLVSPTLVTNARDSSNRLFITQLGGIIKVLQPGSRVPTDFMNITPKVASGGERGLLGLAFHPNYINNRRFFVYYTCTTTNNPNCPATGTITIAEYIASASNPNTADPATERILLTIPHPTNTNHNGGMIEFGPDGYLYIGTGDGGSGNDPPNNAQNINVLLGKMLRIDVDIPQGSTQQYLIPPTNPFAGATAGLDEIYFIGLRNPWRWSFDRSNRNIMMIGDVGQGSVEEIDRVDLTQPPPSGSGAKNFGWRIFEGNSCTNLDGCTQPVNYIPPIAQYGHTGGRCSLTGGYNYHGKRGTFPDGTHIFADYCTGEIFTLQGTTPTVLTTLGGQVSTFGEDEAGEIYAIKYSSTVGGIYKLVDTAVPAPRNEVADFDGDFSTDLSLYRSGTWYQTSSFDGAVSSIQFGLSTDNITPGDYDGDGKTDKAVFRPSTGVWYILNSGNSTVSILQWGSNGDKPVAGDYDGDKKTDLAVFRPTEGNWYVLNSSNNSFSVTTFGLSTDSLMQGDYTGDGKTDVAVFRASTGVWYILPTGGGSPIISQWGVNNDVPVKGDFDGDNKNDLAVFRPSQSVWYILQSSNNASVIRQFGISTDVPVPGDYDADDKTDFAVFRNGVWYILRSSNNASILVKQFGLAGDTPVPAAY